MASWWGKGIAKHYLNSYSTHMKKPAATQQLSHMAYNMVWLIVFIFPFVHQWLSVLGEV